jgi:DNA topoisomerase-2
VLQGGQHVAYIADQIAEAVAAAANKKNKGVDVKAAHVKNYMCLFVNCLVENPAFDSQTKETLTTRAKDFGSEAVLSDKFIKAGTT